MQRSMKRIAVLLLALVGLLTLLRRARGERLPGWSSRDSSGSPAIDEPFESSGVVSTGPALGKQTAVESSAEAQQPKSE